MVLTLYGGERGGGEGVVVLRNLIQVQPPGSFLECDSEGLSGPGKGTLRHIPGDSHRCTAGKHWAGAMRCPAPL